jgi:hypothetical protein
LDRTRGRPDRPSNRHFAEKPFHLAKNHAQGPWILYMNPLTFGKICL